MRLGRGVELDELLRQQDDDRRATVGGRLQHDLDLVPPGELADHVEAEPGGAGDAELRRVRDALVGRLQVLGLHAEAAVLDLDHVPVGHELPADLHVRVRGRERHGVLDQLGEQVDHVTDGPADEHHVAHRHERDPRVVLDLGQRAADHVDHGDRAPPCPGGRGAGQDDEVFRVAPHPDGEVVEPEELLELLGVGLAALHHVEDGQLAVHQALRSAGQAEQDVADAAAQLGLLGGDADGGALDGVERLAHLADLVVTEVERGRLLGDVDLLALADALDDAGQAVVGKLVGGVAQLLQLGEQGPGRGDGQHDRGDDREEAEAAGQDQPDDHVDGDRHRPLDHAVTGVEDHGVEVGQEALGGRLPLRGGERQAQGALVVGHDPVLQGLQPDGRLPLDQLVVGGPVEVGQVGRGLFGGDPPGAHHLGEAGQGVGGQPPVGERAGQQRVFSGEELSGAAQGEQRADVSGELLVVERRQRAVEAVDGVDDVGVRVRRARLVEPARVDALADLLEGLQPRQHLGEPLVALVVESQIHHAGARRLTESRVEAVGLLTLRFQFFARLGGLLAQSHHRNTTLFLQREQQRVARGRHSAVELGDPEEVDALTEGDPRGEDPQGCQGEQHGRDLGPQPRLAEAHYIHPVKVTC